MNTNIKENIQVSELKASAIANINFQEITEISGISIKSQSWGAYWGDFNNDGFADLWANNHLEIPNLYLNKRDGTFVDITSETFKNLLGKDEHGAQWADFDNDGDSDLLQVQGGFTISQIYVNNGAGKLEDKAISLGFDYQGSGRTPQWFDYDNDGLLDIVFATRNKLGFPPTIFRHTTEGFVDVGSDVGFEPTPTGQPFSLLSDIFGDDSFELIHRTGGDKKLTIYDVSQGVFIDITESLLDDIEGKINDVNIADYNGDLLPDLFITRRRSWASDLIQDDKNSFRSYLRSNFRNQPGIEFKATGEVNFEFATNSDILDIDEIFIGSNKINPTDFNFFLNSEDEAVQGIPFFESGVDKGVYIGFNPDLQLWQIFWSDPQNKPIYTFVDSENEITELNPIDFSVEDQFINGQLLINTGNGFIDLSQEAGFTTPHPGKNVISADLDNDMDIDIYVVNTGLAGNRDNFLYENIGNGQFKLVSDSGAEGSKLGLGGSVTTVDSDNDGFLDLFVTNGAFFGGLVDVNKNFFTGEASYQLFRNEPNGNNWLQINLEGVLSNRDGIGAKVYATSEGITQLREQSGGMHERAQNFQRLHFGFAEKEQIDLLEVRWANKVVQRHTAIQSNQIIDITEGIGLENNDTIHGNQQDNRLIGNGGNDFIAGERGNDLIEGNSGRDKLFGNSGQDNLYGGKGTDSLNGGAGDDLLVGGEDADILQGKFGKDVFLWQKPEHGEDTITDFEPSRDSLEFSSDNFANLDIGTLPDDLFVLGSVALESEDRFIYNLENSNLFFDPDGNGKAAPFLIASLSNKAILKAENIVLV